MKEEYKKRKNHLKRILLISLIVIFLISLFISFSFFGPEELVKILGVHNSYILLFIISFFGGFSAWGAVSFLATLITFATSGLNPFLVGITAGTSLFIGDLLMLFIGRKAVKTVDKKWNNRLEKLSKKFNKKTIFIIPFLTFFYIAFIPLPNDIMIAFLAIIDYPFKKVAIPIVLGDYTFTILVSILASQGILLF